MLASVDMTLEDIDRVVLHQANAFILEHLRLKCGIPKDKFCIQLEDTGNTVSASIPIALKKDFDNGLITSGDTVLVAGFGVGYASAATILNM
jgi:3-oxoacyl-[acyl-carrier-protein] synthase-3